MLRDFRGDAFDVIIQAGQSNSQGSGLGKAARPYGQKDSVWRMDGDLTLSAEREDTAGNEIIGNFVHSFADEYIKNGLLKEGRGLLILHAAVGGTGFTDGRWGPKDDLYLRMLTMAETALGLNGNNRLKAVLWHQGETDAEYLCPFGTHYNNLSVLVNGIRTAFNAKGLPFVAGDFVQHWKGENAGKCEPVVSAIRKVCADMPPAAFVETGGLNSNDQEIGNGDSIHFSRAALYEMGVRYFEAYRKAASQTDAPC